MKNAVIVSAGVLREALSRRWFLGMGLVLVAIFAVLALSLELEVVDGALAATKFFGESDFNSDVRAVDVALRPVFEGTAFVIFYSGLLFGVIACADFGPSLLAPGRIEHLLALPVRRHELFVGTYLGVLAISVIGTIFAAGGVVAILGFKSGVFMPRLFLAGALACLSFAALYGLMLTSSLYARSASVSAVVGLAVFVLGVVASFADKIAPAFNSQIGRDIFRTVSTAFPPVASLALHGSHYAGHRPLDVELLLHQVAGTAVFALAAVFLGLWRFEKGDY